MIVLRRKKTRKLDLNRKNLDFFPKNVFDDSTITSLDLSNNNIEEIPANIGDLRHLRILNLENNRIHQLHNGILKCESLRLLKLKGNPMISLPDFIKKNAKFTILTDKESHHYYPEVEIIGINQGLQEEISNEVDGIITHDTQFKETNTVPTVLDDDLTYPRHEDRCGKSLDSCVLFVDIRDSVQKNKDHWTTTMANMYSSFIYGVLRISKEYNGHVRNIIGDRVMIVFDADNSCDNAVKCAGSILYFCKNTMKKTLPHDIFRCGIGIHHGLMKIIKVGLTTPTEEGNDYRNLVWIGDPANLASRLTDKAGRGNLPDLVISKDVYNDIKDSKLKINFKTIDKSKFKDIEFGVYGCNLLIK